MVARLLHSEKRCRGINSLEGLAHRELESLSVFFFVDLVCISSERYGLFGWELASKLGSQVISHAKLELGVRNELLGVFAFLKMLGSAQVIEWRADKFKLTDPSRSKIVLKELVMHHRSVMVLLMPLCRLSRGHFL